MLLNFGAPQLAPNIVQAPTSSLDTNAILGLSPSQYTGLMKHAGTGYYFQDGKFYTPSARPNNSGYATAYGSPFYFNQPRYIGNPNSPYIGNGIGGSSGSGNGGGMTIDGQYFKPIKFGKNQELPAGFVEGDKGIYDISQVYVNSMRPKSTYAPVQNVASFLSTPTAMATPQGSYGAGRYLSGLLNSPINFGINPSQINTNSYQPTMTAQDLSNIVSMGKTNYDLSKAQGNVIQQDGKLIFGDIVDMFRTVQPNPNVADNGRITFGNPLEAAGYVAQNTFGLNND